MKNGREVSNPGNPRPIYECWLDIPLSCQIRPGDSIGIFPRNSANVVQTLIEQQKWADQADVPFKIEFLSGCKKRKTLQFIPEQGSTIRQVLTDCMDLERPPSKLFLLSLLKYSTSPESSQALRILCSKEMMSTYVAEIMEKRVSILRILMLLDIQIPFGVLVENSARLLPRPYSIISGTTTSPGRIRIAFSWDTENPGLTTSMLRTYICDDAAKLPIHFYVRQPTGFRLEIEDTSRNLIMIGPGLGVIPYLGMLEEIQSSGDNQTDCTRLIFTSWRHKGLDDVFLNELEKFTSIAQLHFAYTRDTAEGTPKIYVQDLMWPARKEQIARLLMDPRTKVFICGESKVMIPQIELTLAKCLTEEQQLPAQEAQKMMNSFKHDKRIVIEQWF